MSEQKEEFNLGKALNFLQKWGWLLGIIAVIVVVGGFIYLRLSKKKEEKKE